MIKTQTLYKLYINYLNKKIDKLLISIDSNLDTKEGIQELLLRNRSHIDKYLNIKYSAILNLKYKQSLLKLKIPTSPIYHNGKEINFKAIKLYIESYVMYNGLIHSSTLKVNNLKKRIISFKVYNFILHRFNAKCIDAIIYKNWSMDFYKGAGQIQIRKVENHNKRIDWEKSMKKKQSIIDKGGIPYLKEDAEKIENYKGEKWIIYRPAIDFFIHWFVPLKYKEYVFIFKDFRFVPSRGSNSFVKKLADVKKDREYAFKLYTREKHEWT